MIQSSERTLSPSLAQARSSMSSECTRWRSSGAPSWRTRSSLPRMRCWPKSEAAVREVPDPSGAGSVRLVTVPIGAAGNYGVLAAGFRRPDFPTETDRLLLRVAANQAAGTFEALANERLRLEVATRRQAEQHQAPPAAGAPAPAAPVTSRRAERRRR